MHWNDRVPLVLLPGEKLISAAEKDILPKVYFSHASDMHLCTQEICMHSVLAGGHDQAVLQAALRRLQQPQVARLIAYLLKWVSRQPGENPGACPGMMCFDTGYEHLAHRAVKSSLSLVHRDIGES